jgi:short-subunit dehydrogenase
MRKLRVVITGASSGIGRATAPAFAKRGATVALAARRQDVLREVAAECAALGGRALAVPTDVTDPEAVAELARRADEAFGGIDVWINNAATGVLGPYHKGDLALHRKTIEVNLLGTMYGAYAVLPVFRRQRRGILINNISLGGWAPTPCAAAYTASKCGLRGFTASLRQELSQHPDIHACAVFPSMIDTPGFVHGANVSGRNLDPGPLLYLPEEVAETFVQVARRPRDEVAVGWPARAGQLSYAALRAPTERMMAAAIHFLLARANKAPVSSGAILEPVAEGVATDGGWLARKQLPSASVPTRLGIGAGVAALGWTMLRSARRRRHDRWLDASYPTRPSGRRPRRLLHDKKRAKLADRTRGADVAPGCLRHLCALCVRLGCVQSRPRMALICDACHLGCGARDPARRAPRHPGDPRQAR